MKQRLQILITIVISFLLIGCDLGTLIPNTETTTEEITTESTEVDTVTTISSNQITTEQGILIQKLMFIYDLAIESGEFDGTYEEWLESVKGPQGEPGEDGRDISIQVLNGYIQWKYVGEEAWTNLVELSALVGPVGEDGREVLFQVADGFIQWQYSDETTWTNLIDLATLTGNDGQDGTNGIDGREVLFQVSDGYIQWQYSGDVTWSNLIEIETLTGKDGVSIIATTINPAGELIITYSDNSTSNLGIPIVLYTVNFIDYNGYLLDSMRVPYGSSVQYPNTLNREGYVFDRWSEDTSFIYQSLNVYAQYRTNKYSVSFMTNTDEVIEPLDYIEHGSTISLPILNREGYVFLGWYRGEDINSSQFFNDSEVLSNLNLYARWEKEKYDVNFYDDKSNLISAQEVSFDNSAVEPNIEDVTGYIFIGWDQDFLKVKSDLDIYPIYVVDETDLSDKFVDDNLLKLVYSSVGKNYGENLTRIDLLSVTRLESNDEISDLSGLELCNNLSILALQNSPISDASVLSELYSLEILGLNNTNLTDLEFISDLTKLKMLAIQKYNSLDISPIANLINLENLVITQSPLTDISPLQDLPKLNNIVINQTAVSDLSALYNISNLKYLVASNTDVINIEGISALSNLVTLDLSGNQLLSFEELSMMPNLQYLNIMETGFSESDLVSLDNLSNLKELYLGNAMIYSLGNLDLLPASTKIYLWGLDTNPNVDGRYYAFVSYLSDIKTVMENSNSDIEKVLRVHDYINAISVSDESATVRISDLLIDGRGMCSTYSNSTELLLRMLGIETIVIGGEGHAWNAVYIDDECYHMDGYWNESYGYDYFMISDMTIQSYRSGPMYDWTSQNVAHPHPDLTCVSTRFQALATFLSGFNGKSDDVYLLDDSVIYYDQSTNEIKVTGYDFVDTTVLKGDVDKLLNVGNGIISYLSVYDQFIHNISYDGSPIGSITDLMVVKDASMIQNAIKASVTDPYVLSFNQDIESIDATKIYYQDHLGNITNVAATFEENVLTITPSESLKSQRSYELILLPGAVNNSTNIASNQEIRRYFFTEVVVEPYQFVINYPTDGNLEYFEYFTWDSSELMTIYIQANQPVQPNQDRTSVITVRDSLGNLVDFLVSVGSYDTYEWMLEVYNGIEQLQVGETYTVTVPYDFFMSKIDGSFAAEDFVITVTIIDEINN